MEPTGERSDEPHAAGCELGQLIAAMEPTGERSDESGRRSLRRTPKVCRNGADRRAVG